MNAKFAICALFLLTGAELQAQQTVFSTGFEPPSYFVGGLGGQHGWSLDMGDDPAEVQVESTMVHSGSQAVSITTAGAVTLPNGNKFVAFAYPQYTLASPITGVVDVSIYAYVGAAGTTWSLISLTSSTNGSVGQFYMTSPGCVVLNDSLGLAGVPGCFPVQLGAWNNYRLHVDFGTRTVTGYVNGTLIGSFAIAARNTAAIDVAVLGFGLANAGVGSDPNSDIAYFDDISVTSGYYYYFTHLAVGAGFQTTLTYVNYSTSPVTCTTNFLSDAGAPLSIPFSQGVVSTRTDTLNPGQSLHDQSQASPTVGLSSGWAQAACSGPVEASLLYRLYQQGSVVGEAGVNASTAPTTEFTTFAQTATGVAYANPNGQTATVTITAFSGTGNKLGTATVTLPPNGHGAQNVGPLLGISSFTGWVQIASSIPIFSLSIDAEDFPVFSSLPPGDISTISTIGAVLTTGFEPPSYAPGNLSGQQGWNMYGGIGAANAQVETATVHSGTQAVSVSAVGTTVMPLSQLSSSVTGNINISTYMYLGSFGTSWAPACFFARSGMVGCLYVSSSNCVYVTNGVGASACGHTSVTSWNNYRLHLDFGAQTMTGYVNGVAFGSIAFASSVASAAGGAVGFGQFAGTLGPSGTTTAYFDDISVTSDVNYYFTHLAVGAGFQTTLTYVNYSGGPVTCTTNFLSDSGAPLSIPFSQGAVSTRTDTLGPGQSLHDQSQASPTAALSSGWAQAACSGPVEASVLYRLYQQGAVIGEAGVNASTRPTTEFATFSQTATGIAYANPSATQTAIVTITAISSTGNKLGTATITLPPNGHGAQNVGPLLGIASFTGWVEINSSIPIVSLSIDAEDFPVFSSLPPGDLSESATLF